MKKSRDVETNLKRIPFAAESILAGSILLGLSIATFSPTNILSQFSVLASFTDFVAFLVPGIDRLAKVSNFPEVTRFTSAVLWASVPLLAFISSYPRIYVPRYELIKKHKARGLFFWSMCPVMIFILIVMPIREPSAEELLRKDIYHWAVRSVSDSRVWLGVLGAGITYCAAFLTSAFFTFWPRVWTIYFGNKK
jgi:hypothetical protein